MNRARTATWLAAIGLAAVGSCTYDFDAAFEGTPSAAGTTTGTPSTETGTSTGAGMGGQAAAGGLGGTAGAGGGATGGQGTGAQAGGENCANGTDDDGDGEADCADTDCQIDWECAVPAPTGWEGPAAFYLGDPAGTPSCGAPWSGQLICGVGIDTPDAQCHACTCDPPVVSCGYGRLRYYNSFCSGELGSDSAGPAGQCWSDSSPTNADAIGLEEGSVQSATCAESGGGVSDLPDWSWQQQGLFCTGELRQVGCASGNLCAPRPTATFRRCVYRQGAGLPCSSPYSEQLVVYIDGTEGRDCSSCSCGPAGNAQCTGSIELWENSGCNGTADYVIDSGTCAETPNFEGVFNHRFTADYTADDCTPSGGEPTGSVSPSDPYTVCCLP